MEVWEYTTFLKEITQLKYYNLFLVGESSIVRFWIMLGVAQNLCVPCF